jgi:hypothetical protein
MRQSDHQTWRAVTKAASDSRFLPISLSHCLIVFILALNAHAEPVSFSREVLPILSEHCLRCHGPDGTAMRVSLFVASGAPLRMK